MDTTEKTTAASTNTTNGAHRGAQAASTSGRSWRRRLLAFGSMVAIALGGLSMVTPAQADEAGVQQTVLVVQTASPAVVGEGNPSQHEQ